VNKEFVTYNKIISKNQIATLHYYAAKKIRLEKDDFEKVTII